MGVSENTQDKNATRLRKATFYNDFAVVEKLIRDNWCPHQSSRWINQMDAFGWAAIHYACFQGNLEICRKLIAAGTDVNLCTERARETPLFLAAAVNAHRIVEYLLQVGADPNIGEITGKIPVDVSFGKSEKLLREDRLKYGRLIRMIPTVRKLLASKFVQLLLQLVLCIFLEIFQDSLLVKIIYFFIYFFLTF